MYIPKSYREEDLPTLHAMMRAYNFAALVSVVEGRLYATHLPFMVDTERGPYGTLVAHMARANDQWRYLEPEDEAMVIFQGPHDYITPSWYTTPVAAPTWNYAAIHAYGKPRLIHDAAHLRPMVSQLAAQHEAAFARPWTAEQAESIMDNMLKAIVGLEIEIERLEGKYKFSQNRSAEDQQGVIAGLERTDSPQAHEVAAVMRRNVETARGW
jgi:transcriptional regulator